MFSETHQTGTLGAPRQAPSVWFGAKAGWLILGLAIVSLLAGLIWSNNLVRYPGAERQEATLFQVRFQYQTADDLPKVLRWYAQLFDLSHEIPQGDSCVMVTGEDAVLFFQESLAVTLCAQQKHTLIFVNRSLVVR